MQTFLPFPDFGQSAAVLDNRRLGKQRVETMQLMHALIDPDYGWQNHPALRMWRGYGCALMRYQVAIVTEWKSHVTLKGKPFVDNCLEPTWEMHNTRCIPEFHGEDPWWLGNAEFHQSHQLKLIDKNPEFYGAAFDPMPQGEFGYLWPTGRSGQHTMTRGK